MRVKVEKVLVTGASGHLGSFLTRLLVKEGYQVTILVRSESNLWRISDILSSTRIITGDLSKIEGIIPELTQLAPDIVFHLAWFGVKSDLRNDGRQIDYNLFGTIQLLQAVLKAGCKCWVGVGSQAEYGPYQDILREDFLPRPDTLYGATKLCIGLLSQQLCERAGVRHLWFRLLATYGPKDDRRNFIPSLVLKLLAREKPSLTSGEQQWDYLYIEDAVEVIYQSAMNSQAKGIFNLGSGKANSIKSIAEKIRDLIDFQLPLGFGELPYSSKNIQYLQTDITLLQKSSGWMPKVSLEEGLKRTIEWYRDQQKDSINTIRGRF